jgi:hypothetical protein
MEFANGLVMPVEMRRVFVCMEARHCSPISLAREFHSTQNNGEVNVLSVRVVDVLEIDLGLASEFPAFLQMHITRDN